MMRIKGVAQIGRAKGLFDGLAVAGRGKTPGAAEIVLRPGATDRRILLITIDEKFHFTFAPPVAFE